MSKMKRNVENDSSMSQLKIHEVPAVMAVQSGLITQEFLDAELEKMRLSQCITSTTFTILPALGIGPNILCIGIMGKRCSCF